MNRLMVGAVACLGSWVSVGGSSAIADDRELQAILSKEACVPLRINPTALSPAVTAYEVTCRGSSRVLTILCLDARCTLQPTPPQDEQGQKDGGSGDA